MSAAEADGAEVLRELLLEDGVAEEAVGAVVADHLRALRSETLSLGAAVGLGGSGASEGSLGVEPPTADCLPDDSLDPYHILYNLLLDAGLDESRAAETVREERLAAEEGRPAIPAAVDLESTAPPSPPLGPASEGLRPLTQLPEGRRRRLLAPDPAPFDAIVWRKDQLILDLLHSVMRYRVDAPAAMRQHYEALHARHRSALDRLERLDKLTRDQAKQLKTRKHSAALDKIKIERLEQEGKDRLAQCQRLDGELTEARRELAQLRLQSCSSTGPRPPLFPFIGNASEGPAHHRQLDLN